MHHICLSTCITFACLLVASLTAFGLPKIAELRLSSVRNVCVVIAEAFRERSDLSATPRASPLQADGLDAATVDTATLDTATLEATSCFAVAANDSVPDASEDDRCKGLLNQSLRVSRA